MPWIRFWHQGRCPSGLNGEESSYVYYNRRLSDDVLKSEADERVPSWRQQSERGYRYGFERVKRLPAKVRDSLIKGFVEKKAHAERMLRLLRAQEYPGRKKPGKRTAWDRIKDEADG